MEWLRFVRDYDENGWFCVFVSVEFHALFYASNECSFITFFSMCEQRYTQKLSNFYPEADLYKPTQKIRQWRESVRYTNRKFCNCCSYFSSPCPFYVCESLSLATIWRLCIRFGENRIQNRLNDNIFRNSKATTFNACIKIYTWCVWKVIQTFSNMIKPH